MTETVKTADTTAWEAVAFAREEVRSGSTEWHRKCLKFVRMCWGLPAVFPTAADAWKNAEHKHSFTKEEDIPFGAPVFSERPGAGPNDAGHVFIAGGYNRKGQRIYRGPDLKVLGGISVFRLSDLQEKWGHEILGWSKDLNGYMLNLPAPKRRPSRRK